eukprot:1621-Heterococcus_DN1.PRE.2
MCPFVRCRLVGPQCTPGQQQQQASLACDNGSICIGAAILNNLRLTTGSWEMLEDFKPEYAFPCIEPDECVLLDGCSISAYMVSAAKLIHNAVRCQWPLLIDAAVAMRRTLHTVVDASATALAGTAMLIDGARVAAQIRVFTSNELFLGVVMVQDDAAAISMLDCSLQHNMWGAFLGRNLSADSERAVLAVNTFRWNSDEDITRMYEYDEQTVQPWRRSWATTATIASTATTASTNSADSTTATDSTTTTDSTTSADSTTATDSTNIAAAATGDTAGTGTDSSAVDTSSTPTASA